MSAEGLSRSAVASLLRTRPYKLPPTMLEAAKKLFLIVSALFPIVDPLGGSPFFLAMTNEYLPEARRALSWQIALNSFVLLVASYFVGTYILAFFGISLPIVQVGGGIVLVAMGPTGMSVMTKLSSFLLVCIGAQIVWNGIKTLLESVTLRIAP